MAHALALPSELVDDAAAAHARAAIAVVTPLRVLAWAFGLFFVGLLVAPVQPDVLYSQDAVWFFAACVAAAFAGTALGGRPASAAAPAGTIDWRAGARRCLALGLVGVLLLAADRYFIRGATLDADVLEARAALDDSNSSGLSAIAAVLASFAGFGWISVWTARAHGQAMGRLADVVGAFNLLAFVALSLTLGSRSLFMVCAMLHVIAALYLRHLRGLALSRRVVAAGVLIAVGVVAALAGVLVQRLTLMELSPIDSIQLSVYAYTLKPPEAVLDFLQRNEFLDTFGTAVYSLLLYLFHGVYEFMLLFDSYRGPHTGGMETLWLPLKVLQVAQLAPPSVDLEQFDGFRSGVFTTFAGMDYVDFGGAAPFAIAIVFYLLAQPARRLAAGDGRWLFAAAHASVVLWFAPMTDLLQSATGAYLLVAALAMVALVPRRAVPAPAPLAPAASP